ncbi:MAG: putative ribonuclease VapC [Candidatus Gottesmanbacteria bacterium GW2011_GWC2_39_8]|uniref:Putative ribonuclease VapC n=1 Tax=Candidatus Gottesmanbacteria bacterium GW2011_GWC2_39_8 TaxID=1618450 RepID=A0A0G0PZC6_9BACT|nr:MAG: putative ribonuclease VapC [Candidatus Gottesmanbacteria bacterium GW2011_GWC2_39_8]
MYILDTNILIWVLRKNKTFVDLYHSLKHETLVSISTITVAEIYKNVLPNESVDTEELLNDFKIWDVTSTIARRGGLYWQQFMKKSKNLNILDCLIVATAKEHELTLVTLNSRHFPMDDIKVLDPGKK